MVKYQVVMMTLEWAQQLIDGQTEGSNRNVRWAKVSAYCSDMIKGKWRTDNGAFILIDEQGGLIDGQHRLLALLKYGKPLMMLVATDVPRDAMGTVDNGMIRTIADYWRIVRKLKNCNKLAAAVRWIIRYERSCNGFLASHSGAFTNSDFDDALDNNQGIVQSLEFIGPSCELGQLLSVSVLAFVHYMGGKTSPAAADRFIVELKSGTGESETSPVVALRKVLVRQALSNHKLQRDRLCALVIKAWLAYERGENIKLLKLNDGEKFPRFACDRIMKAA